VSLAEIFAAATVSVSSSPTISGGLRAQQTAEWKGDFRDVRQFPYFLGHGHARRRPRLELGEDTLRLPVLFTIAVASLSTVAWLLLQADLNFQEVDGTAPTALRSDEPRHFEIARAANPTTARILALDEARRLAFWTLVLNNRRQACDIAVRASYTGANGSGLDQWTVVCRDGNEYSVSVEPNAKDSVCVGNAFDRSK
jgi:hypothetical protein